MGRSTTGKSKWYLVHVIISPPSCWKSERKELEPINYTSRREASLMSPNFQDHRASRLWVRVFLVLSGLFQKVMGFRKKDLGNLRYVGQVEENCGSPGPITSVFHDKQYGGSESLICRIWHSLQESHVSIYLNWGVPNWYQNVGFPHIQLVTEVLNTQRTVIPLNIAREHLT